VQEKGNLIFEVLRKKVSQDHWEKVGTIASKGDSSHPVTYSYLDEESSHYESYHYRIRQVSIDGSESWSTVISTFAKSSENEVVLFPNPHQNGPLNIHYPKGREKVHRLAILNANGQLLTFINPTSEIAEELISSFPAGIYFLQVEFSDKLVIKRFIKE
jgi:hypothetical protein